MNFPLSVSHAWRALRRAPAFTACVVLTLTIGIGASAAIFAIVDAVLIRPLPYANPERLVGAWFDMPAINLLHAQQTSGTYRTFKAFARTIDGIGLYQDGSLNVSDPNGSSEPARLNVAWTTATVFPVLGVTPIVGRAYGEPEDAPKGAKVAMISEALWMSRFGGDRAVIGRKLMIGGSLTEIIGVMSNTFRFPSPRTEIWLPLQIDPNEAFPGGFNYSAVARLKPGVTIDAAQRDFTNVLPRVVEVSPNLAPGVTTKMVLDQAKPVPRLVAMRDDVVGDSSRTLWMVAATALLVLLVTTANVANLLLVRADARHRELSVRAALGAGRARVLAHFLAESALLSAVSAALGIAVAAMAIRILVTAGPAQIPRLAEVAVDGRVIGFTLIVATLVAVVCSAIPAVRFLRADPLSGLREGGRSGTAGARRQRMRSALVAAQVAFALVVLAASGLLLRSFQRLRAVRPGFNADGVATLWISIPTAKYKSDTSVVQFYSQLTARVAQVPGVQAVGLTSHVPMTPNGLNQDPFYVEGDATTASKIPPLEIYSTVDSGYFKAMGIPLIAGRGFDHIERQNPSDAIISQETARALFHDSTGRAALNKRFQELPNSPWHTIVGVVGSVRDTSLAAPPARSVYYPEAVGGDQTNSQLKRMLAIVAHTNGDVAATTRAIQRVVRELDPTLPTFDVRSMRDAVDGSMARVTFTMVILAVAAGVTLVLGMIGLYGVIAYVVALRTREIGVRIALGAPPRSIASMVTKEGLALTGIGIAGGLAIVVAGSRFVRGLLYDVAPTDPLVLSGATALMIVCAIAASWIPSRRAARVNPTEALQSE